MEAAAGEVRTGDMSERTLQLGGKLNTRSLRSWSIQGAAGCSLFEGFPMLVKRDDSTHKKRSKQLGAPTQKMKLPSIRQEVGNELTTDISERISNVLKEPQHPT